MTTILYPSAEYLDCPDVQRHVSLYLVPPEESESGQIEIEAHGGYGTIGTPAAAWHDRWLSLGTLPRLVTGESALAALQDKADLWRQLAAQYLGSYWDGCNYNGRWANEGGNEYDWMDSSDFEFHDESEGG